MVESLVDTWPDQPRNLNSIKKRPDLAPVVTGGSSILPLFPASQTPHLKQIVSSKKPFETSGIFEASGDDDGEDEHDTDEEDTAVARLGMHGRQDSGRRTVSKIPLLQERCDGATWKGQLPQHTTEMARQSRPWPSWCAAISRKV